MSFSYYTPVQFFLEFYTWIRCSLVKDEQYLCSGGRSLLCKRFISSRCMSSPEFPSVDGPWKRFFIRRLKSLLLTDQAQNGLHITVMSRKLAKCLSNNIVWKYAGHFVFVPKGGFGKFADRLSREGKSGEGAQWSCVTSYSLVSYIRSCFCVVMQHVNTHKKKLHRRLLPPYLSP